MFTYNSLYCFRARHSGLFAHESSYCPESEPSDLGHFPKHCWPYTVLQL